MPTAARPLIHEDAPTAAPPRPSRASEPEPPRPSRAPEPARSHDAMALDDLLALEQPALEALYAGARVPDLDAIAGDLRGRMLATTVLSGSLAALARAWAGSRAFPWRGKSFRPLGDGRGEGKNRVVSDRLRLFRFETSIGRSRASSPENPFDAVQLDYDLPDNPRVIRMIKDEIRELAPGLYLGQAYLAPPRGRERLVLYFGLAHPERTRGADSRA